MSVQADLRIDVNGAAATLTGDGARLVLATEEPGALWSSLAGAPLPAGVGSVNGPRAIGRVAEALREAGLALDVRGPRGIVASLGTGVDSSLGRVITGSSALHPGAPAVLAPLMWQDLRQRPGARAAGLALAGIGGIVLAGVARRRRR